MSDDHKAALARGRQHSRAVRAYLEALAARRGRPVAVADRGQVAERVAAIDAQLAQADPTTKVRLIQERLDLTTILASASEADELDRLRLEFVQVAAEYGRSRGITYPAWREVGVPVEVLAEAGITRKG